MIIFLIMIKTINKYLDQTLWQTGFNFSRGGAELKCNKIKIISHVNFIHQLKTCCTCVVWKLLHENRPSVSSFCMAQCPGWVICRFLDHSIGHRAMQNQLTHCLVVPCKENQNSSITMFDRYRRGWYTATRVDKLTRPHNFISPRWCAIHPQKHLKNVWIWILTIRILLCK